MTHYRLGRERIPGRTVLSAIPADTEPLTTDSLPMLCPGFECGTGGRMLDVDDQGTARCAACDLTLTGVLPPVDA
jgi:hypothetical protein